jgi:hypothetical protein
MTDIDIDWGVCNPGPRKLFVWLEPWAEEFETPARSTIALRLSGESADNEPCETEVTTDHIVVWVGAGHTALVFIDGNLQDSASAFLAVPEGLGGSTRAFLNLVFGSQPSARVAGRPFEPRLTLWQQVRRLLRL